MCCWNLPDDHRVAHRLPENEFGSYLLHNGERRPDGNSENVGFQGGLDPHYISMRQFLTSTATSDYPQCFGSATGKRGELSCEQHAHPLVPPNDISVTVNSSDKQIDLAGFFSDSDTTNSKATFNITYNAASYSVSVTLFDKTAPQNRG